MTTHNDLVSKNGFKQSILSVMGFIAVGVFCFVLACAILLLQPDTLTGEPIRGIVLAVTHLVTLGWIASLLFAGAYLLGPVLAGSPLWSQRLPQFHLICHVTGLVLMVGGLVSLRYEIASFGAGILFLGLLALAWNLLMTAGRRSLWTPSNLAFQTAIFWLGVTGAVALVMLRTRLFGQAAVAPETLIALHAHFALFGFLAQGLLAVSLKVVPDLLGVKESPPWMDRFGWAGWLFLNVGLLILFPVALGASHDALLISGTFIALGIIAFSIQIVGFLMVRRERLTWGPITHITGILLLVLIVLGALWKFPDAGEGSSDILRSWMRLYISLSLLGPFAFALLGTGERLIPHLIWLLRFSPWEGIAKIPSPSTLVREAAGGPIFFSLLLGWGYLAAGQIAENAQSIQIGAILMLVALGWYIVGISPALLRFILGVVPTDFPDSPSFRKPISDS